ncbi:hypothetical protein RQP46_010523 [Phenoliferia psychrophenolica]
MRPLSLVSVVVSTLSLLVSPSSGASLLAIDYGTDGFKASLVKPGVPFDVLINQDSKRKTPSLVTLRGEDRSFGSEASNLATRFPKDTLTAVKLLLGHPSSHPQSALHSTLFANTQTTTSRGSPALAVSSGSYSVEEILAMQFGYAKEMAEETAGEGVRDAVVTVPSWFGHSERQAVLDALDLAGLRSIGLVNDGTAAAVNYAMTRTFPPEPSYHLLYDFGAASLRTTVVSLRSALLPDQMSLAAKPELKNVTALVVHAHAFDINVGGYAFDRLVRDVIKEEFETKTGKDLSADPRAMAKLLKEASRVKQVLSANSESSARIEGLIDDMDLRTVVSRSLFETRARSLVPSFTQPIIDVLALSNLTIADIESVILVGGSSRVPMVEAAVRQFVGEDKIAKNLNADEAAVMGAALYGAGITKGFRTKDIRVQDVSPYAVDVAYEADKKDEEAEPRTIRTHLFPALSKLGTTKTMTFKKSADFAIQFSYRKSPLTAASEQPEALFETTISGLTTALTNLTTEAIANSTVKVTISLSESGLVSVSKAVVLLEGDAVQNLSLNDKLKGFLGSFGGKKDGDAKKPVDPNADPDAPEVEDPFEGIDEKEQEATRLKIEELMKSMPTNETVVLQAQTVFSGRVPMSLEDKTEAKKRLREMKAAETRKLAREEARNVLEAYIYKARDLVDQSSFVDASLDSERKAIRDKTEAANEWLWDEADNAPTKELKAKKSELEKLIKHVTVRSSEASQRSNAIKAFKLILSTADAFALSARTNTTLSESKKETPRHTLVEIEALTKLSSDAREWLSTQVKSQDSKKAHEDPVLRVAEVERKAREVENEVNKLMKKKAPRKSKVLTPKSESKVEESATKVGEDKPEETPERPKDEL